MTCFMELLAKESHICKYLGTQPLGIKGILPSEDDLNSFKLYLEKQEADMNRLKNTFEGRRSSLITMVNELGITPTSSFEYLVCNDAENFILTSNNMTRLVYLYEKLKLPKDEATKQAEELRLNLITLWKYFGELQSRIQSFLTTYSGYDVNTIKALTQKIKYCEEKRKENIGQYIIKMRTELTKLWDLCKYGEHQRNKFVAFHCNIYTEDLLTLHELIFFSSKGFLGPTIFITGVIRTTSEKSLIY